jgi:hypothetical protein
VADLEIAKAVKVQEETKPAEPRPRNHAFRILMAAQEFTADAEALQEVVDVARPVLVAKEKERSAELDRLRRNENSGDGEDIHFNLMEMHRLVGLFAKQKRGGFLFRGHLLVALVSRFDGFVSQIARELLLHQPARLGKEDGCIC